MQIHQQIVRQRDKQFLQIRHDQHLRTAQIRRQIIVVHTVVKRNESNFGASASGQRVETGLNGPRGGRQHAAAHGRGADIEDKKVRGFLRGSDHVLGRRDKLHHSLTQFRTIEPIASQSLFVQMTKVRRWAVVALTANVAPPSSTVFAPRNKRVHVGTTTFATNNPCRPGFDRGDFTIVRTVGCQWTQHGTHGDFRCAGHLSRLWQLGTRPTKDTRWDTDTVIDIVIDEYLLLLLLGCCSSRHAGHGSRSNGGMGSGHSIHGGLRRCGLKKR